MATDNVISTALVVARVSNAETLLTRINDQLNVAVAASRQVEEGQLEPHYLTGALKALTGLPMQELFDLLDLLHACRPASDEELQAEAQEVANG